MVTRLSSFWFGVVVDRVPDDFVEGIVLATDFENEAEAQPENLRYLILARAHSSTQADAQGLIARATKEMEPTAFFLIADRAQAVIRSERRLADSLGENDVSLKAAFLGFKRGSEAAQASALRVLESALTRQWWQFWK